MSDISSEAIVYIQESSYALLVTVGDENKPFVRYVGPVVNDGPDIYFVTRIVSQKVKHIGDNPRVVLHFQNPSQASEQFKSLSVSGTAVRIANEMEFRRALDKLEQKAPAYGTWIRKDGFASWAIYKTTAQSLQWTDLSKSSMTITEDLH
jgi:nitroimidazol reductase NimA-like FMN-containing flavoprotein (pyridoxamine 5'-phosphate oxidase superfamily)